MSSWLTAAENPAADTEIRSKTCARIIQDFLQANWAYPDIASQKIGWGYPGRLLGGRSGKSITLRCIPIIELARKEDAAYRLTWLDETLRIDIYMRDEAALPKYVITPRLEGMMRYIQDFIRSNMHSFAEKGISGIENLYTYAIPADEPGYSNKIFHGIVTLHAWYRMRTDHAPTI
jgi:hypothetical protein